MHINPQKSGIMVVRKDRRTHEFKTDSWREIPLVNEYKYLGLMITDSLKLLPLYKDSFAHGADDIKIVPNVIKRER